MSITANTSSSIPKQNTTLSASFLVIQVAIERDPRALCAQTWWENPLCVAYRWELSLSLSLANGEKKVRACGSADLDVRVLVNTAWLTLLLIFWCSLFFIFLFVFYSISLNQPTIPHSPCRRLSIKVQCYALAKSSRRSFSHCGNTLQVWIYYSKWIYRVSFVHQRN